MLTLLGDYSIGASAAAVGVVTIISTLAIRRKPELYMIGCAPVIGAAILLPFNVYNGFFEILGEMSQD